jgi:hypothetical protein
MANNPLDIKGPQFFPITVSDIVTLIHNIKEGSKNNNVGYEDANTPLAMLIKYLERKPVYIRKDNLESALWSCNLMDEDGKFWDHSDRKFEEVLKSMHLHKRFNRQYNTVE